MSFDFCDILAVLFQRPFPSLHVISTFHSMMPTLRTWISFTFDLNLALCQHLFKSNYKRTFFFRQKSQARAGRVFLGRSGLLGSSPSWKSSPGSPAVSGQLQIWPFWSYLQNTLHVRLLLPLRIMTDELVRFMERFLEWCKPIWHYNCVRNKKTH